MNLQESSDWKHGVWFTLEEQIGPRLHGNDRQLLDWLIKGRPIFGRTFDTGWERYAYFSKAEVEVLRAALGRGLAAGPSPYTVDYGRDFPEELLNWLEEVMGHGQDLWVMAQ